MRANRREFLMSAAGAAVAAGTRVVPVNGPLRVNPKNPRYFTDNTGKAVYLTGSHTWANLQDIGMPPVQPFDWPAYRDMMLAHNHNFMRFWHWTQSAWAPWTEDKILFAPSAYMRTGPGTALDGGPKFDLSKFNPEYFGRMRERLTDARDHGIYAAVQLFQSFSANKNGKGDRTWLGNPYNGANNINGFDAEKKGTGEVDLMRADVRDMQARYMRKVVETVWSLDNILYEVINEGGNKDWDWWVVNTVHKLEADKGVRHPVGLTGYSPEPLSSMLESPCEWVSAGSNDGQFFKNDPPAWDGRKVSVLDTDHLWGHGGTVAWVWKAFTRGHNSLLMDPWDPIPGRVRPGGENWSVRPGYPNRDVNLRDHWTWEPVRKAMGHARRYALRMDLNASAPHNELASTNYCLAVPGKEYAVYLPEGDEVEIDLRGRRPARSQSSGLTRSRARWWTAEPSRAGESRRLWFPSPARRWRTCGAFEPQCAARVAAPQFCDCAQRSSAVSRWYSCRSDGISA
jgi:hypothetical protein